MTEPPPAIAAPAGVSVSMTLPPTAPQGSVLTLLLELVENPAGSTVQYVIGGHTLTRDERETAAQMLADDAMRIRCGQSPLLARWRAQRDGTPGPDNTRREALASYIKIGFGLPDDPHSDDHMQGHVAELLWNRLVHERLVCKDGRRLVRAHPVKADPLEPGGDGLVIYEISGETLVFRLWEIKKHGGQQKVSRTIRGASKQLAQRGNEYLAKLAGPETIEQAGPLGDLYAELVELWLDRSERAGAGVSVSTSTAHAPPGPGSFTSLATAFPEFHRPGQIEGIVIAMPDFPAFATRVREIVWSGL